MATVCPCFPARMLALPALFAPRLRSLPRPVIAAVYGADFYGPTPFGCPALAHWLAARFRVPDAVFRKLASATAPPAIRSRPTLIRALALIPQRRGALGLPLAAIAAPAALAEAADPPRLVLPSSAPPDTGSFRMKHLIRSPRWSACNCTGRPARAAFPDLIPHDRDPVNAPPRVRPCSRGRAAASDARRTCRGQRERLDNARRRPARFERRRGPG